MRWAEIKGEPHMQHQFPSGPPSLSPTPTTFGEQGGEPALGRAWKNSRVGGPGDTRSICLIVPRGDEAPVQEERGPQLTAEEEQASGPGPSQHVQAGAPSQGCHWPPSPDLLSRLRLWNPVWEMLTILQLLT